MDKLNLKNIEFLRINLCGSSYSNSLDDEVCEKFHEDGLNVVVSGHRTIAAGPELWMEIILGIGESFVVDIIEHIIKKVYSAIQKNHSIDCHVNKLTIDEYNCKCEFEIKSNSAAGMIYEQIDLELMLNRMHQLIDNEKIAGRYINKIETPCDVQTTTTDFSVRCVGVGNYSVWRISYENDIRCKNWLYDAVNENFIPITDSSIITCASNSNDIFYKTK